MKELDEAASRGHGITCGETGDTSLLAHVVEGIAEAAGRVAGAVSEARVALAQDSASVSATVGEHLLGARWGANGASAIYERARPDRDMGAVIEAVEQYQTESAESRPCLPGHTGPATTPRSQAPRPSRGGRGHRGMRLHG